MPERQEGTSVKHGLIPGKFHFSKHQFATKPGEFESLMAWLHEQGGERGLQIFTLLHINSLFFRKMTRTMVRAERYG